MKTRYLVDVQELKRNCTRLHSYIQADRYFYAMKANAEERVLSALVLDGYGFEVASVEEFRRANKAPAHADNVICGLPVKPREVITQLYRQGVRYFVFDRLDELEKLNRDAPDARKIARLYVKDLDGESAEWGMPPDTILRLLEAGQEIDGLSFHIARNYQVRHITHVMDRVEKVLSACNRPMIVNIGGGYRAELPAHLALRYNLGEFYLRLAERLGQIKNHHTVEIYCEPGRGIIQSACHILAEVVLADRADDVYRVFLNMNIGSMTGSHPLHIKVMGDGEEECVYSAQWHMSQQAKEAGYMTAFIDTICEYRPFFSLPLTRPVRHGEVLKLEGMGAYTFSQAYDFHCRERIAYAEG
ncbi:MAG TPA: hypothetical protein VHT96_08805 [Clostridia bacterium]|nr:hypothetical protein [Clostridia bacterium]